MGLSQNKKGYSLVVVIIAMAIFVLGILSVMALMPSGQQAVNRTVFASRAATIAEREFNRIRICYSDPESPAPPPEISGSEPDGFRWKAEISGSEIYTVTLTVWRQHEGKTESEIFETKFTRK